MSNQAADDSPGCGLPSAVFLGVFVVVLLMLAAVTINWDQLLGALRQGNNQPAPGAGQGSGRNPIPPVSNRLYTSGTATTTVAGGLHVAGQVSIDPIASYTQDGMSWISFRDGGDSEILVVLNEPEDSVTVAQGSHVAIGQDEDCDFNITVSPSSVSGSVSCASVDVFDNGEPAGTASIQLQFSTTTTPMEDGNEGTRMARRTTDARRS